MARNIEIKARVRDWDAARRTAQALATQTLGVLGQTDTYFVVPRGRLKLREIDGQPAELIYYDRADQAAARSSDYQITPVSDPAAIGELLMAALGVRNVVRKRREVYLVDNVRIHLDDVEGLGTFLEFEAVVDDQHDEAACFQALATLQAAFKIDERDLVNRSYGKLLG